MNEKDFIIGVVQQHIKDNTFYKLPEIFNNPEVRELANQINFGWPDFLDPYVREFGAMVKEIDYKTLSFEGYRELLSQYNDIASVCISLGLNASFGYLRNSVCEDLQDLREKCIDAFQEYVPKVYAYEWTVFTRKDTTIDDEINPDDIPF